MRMNILVVDDEFHTCQLMAEKIRSFAFDAIESVLCAGSGEEALRILEGTSCHILITDVCMSPMDGLELISKAREKVPELICVLLSAFDEFAYAQRGIQLRIRDYWLKPVNEESMRRSLLEMIREYQSSQDRSRTLLDTIINSAVLTGDKTLEDIFHGISDYPGNGGYVVVWEESVYTEIAAEGFWICKLLDGKSLFACPDTKPSPGPAEKLKKLLEQAGMPCGVSKAGNQVTELYRQAEYALSLRWVWEGRKTIFYEETGLSKDSLHAAVKETLTKAMTVTAANMDGILAAMAEYRTGMEEFAFAVYVDRVYRGLLEDIAGLTGKPWRKGVPRCGQGWKKPVEAALRELLSAKGRQTGSRKKDPIQWSIAYIDSHYGDADLDMTLLADKLEISYQYFSELFHKQIGKTFSEYILELRMKEACRSLLQGELVSDVSKKVGYQHTHSFTRAFKRMYGISPNAFRSMNG